MKKVFISQPMNGRGDAEIIAERKAMMEKAKEAVCDDVQEIDSFFQEAPHDAKPLWYLGESLKLLAEADIAIFAPGASEARGCKIERACCDAYGIRALDL